MKTFILALFLLVALNAQAQNYHTVTNQDTIYIPASVIADSTLKSNIDFFSAYHYGFVESEGDTTGIWACDFWIYPNDKPRFSMQWFLAKSDYDILNLSNYLKARAVINRLEYPIKKKLKLGD